MKDKRLLGVDENNRGYSSFLFNRNNTKDHCFIGQSAIFNSIRVKVAIFMILVVILIMILVPHLVINDSYYDCIYEIIKKEPDRRYYLQATVVVMLLVEYFALSVDLYVVIDGLYEHTYFDDVKLYYFLGLMFVMAHFIVNLSTTIIVAFLHNTMSKIKNLPILCSFQNHHFLVIFIHCLYTVL